MSKKKDHKDHKDPKDQIDEEVAAAVNAEADESLLSEIEAAAENAAPEESTPADTVEKLTADVAQANERYLRLMAEFDNYKKRTSREYQRMVELANEKIIGELTDVRNTFELAIKHGETSSDYQKLFDGIKLIFTKFDGVLTSNGLSAFGEVGEPFDPQIHDALMKTPHDTIPEDHIATMYEKGYRLHDRIIKHAKVIVSSGKPEAAAEESSAA